MTKVKATCPACQKQFQLPPQVVGKKAKCNGCETVFVIPKPVIPATTNRQAVAAPVKQLAASKTKRPPKPAASSTSPQDANAKIKSLQAMLSGKTIKTGRVSLLYRINILVTSFVMLLLPIAYLCMIAAVCYAVYYHTVNHVGMMGAVRGRGVILMAIAYAAPILGGIVLVFFMLKPLLARRGDDSRKRKVNAKGEPVLFWFVEKICEAVGSPVPRQVYITHDINAAASFEHGMRSAIVGRNLSLHIGMPLVAGLTLQQFGGVLAHEFGHFSQGAGMRLSLFIRSINFWFARVVYERDAWDEGLASLVDDDTDFRFALLIMFAQLCVFLSRGFLWVLMMIGQLVSSLLLRQMEFDADKYEIQFSGSENFQQTSDRLQILNVSYGEMIPSIIQAAIQGKTVKNLPKQIVEKSQALDPKKVKQVLAASHSMQAGLFDSHPSDGQRIEKARAYEAEGIFHSKAPAAALFSGFEQTCQSITDDFYRNEFGVTKEMIRDAPRGRRR